MQTKCSPIVDGVHFGMTYIKSVGEFNWTMAVTIPFTAMVIPIVVGANVAVIQFYILLKSFQYLQVIRHMREMNVS